MQFICLLACDIAFCIQVSFFLASSSAAAAAFSLCAVCHKSQFSIFTREWLQSLCCWCIHSHTTHEIDYKNRIRAANGIYCINVYIIYWNTIKYYCAIAFHLSLFLSLSPSHNLYCSTQPYFPFHLSFINLSVTYINAGAWLYTLHNIAIIYWIVKMHSGEREKERDTLLSAIEHISNCRIILLQRGLLLSQAISSPINYWVFFVSNREKKNR